ncbi:hypothetical protein HYFRA_00002037 [Hymenoscyphus fraxineus]|uniref:Uncharacterized protein n=1 Tax=Hymenoscyphus fraxineus TaxID=746836 RepID=A0A9N9KL25_9HELO|nr:hypothetical protein HYFRA_00002037 [Hymenoscyphus fraxineus]
MSASNADIYMCTKPKNKQSQLDKINLEIAVVEQEFTQLSVVDLIQEKTNEDSKEIQNVQQRAEEYYNLLAMSELPYLLVPELDSVPAKGNGEVDNGQGDSSSKGSSSNADGLPTPPIRETVISARHLPNGFREVLVPDNANRVSDLENEKLVENFDRLFDAVNENDRGSVE